MDQSTLSAVQVNNLVSPQFPIGMEVPDNFSPTLRSRIFFKGTKSIMLESTCGTSYRTVSLQELDMMVYGV